MESGLGMPAASRMVGTRSMELTGMFDCVMSMVPGQLRKMGVRNPPSCGERFDFGANLNLHFSGTEV